MLCLELRQIPVGLQCLEDVVSELMGASPILANVVKYMVEPLAGLGLPCLLDYNLLTSVNNEPILHTINTIVRSILINNILKNKIS